MTVLEFDGIPFDPLGAPQARQTADSVATAASSPDANPAPVSGTASAAAPISPVGTDSPQQSSSVAGVAPASDPAAVSGADPTGAVAPVNRASLSAGAVPAVPAVHRIDPIAEIRAGVVAAHRSALSAQIALQRGIWRQALLRQGAGDTLAADASPVAVVPAAAVAPEGAFKALARTDRVWLDRAALEQLVHGEFGAVFGAGYHRAGVESVARLAATTALVLTEVSRIDLYGGGGNGFITAQFESDPRAAALQAAEVFALYTGMPLCISGSALTGGVSESAAGSTTGTVELVIESLDLVPRPHLVATASFGPGIAPVGVTVTVVEPQGADVGPGSAAGALLLNEFHMAHLARGDQSIAMGPEFAEYTGIRATRLPTGGLLLVDRVREFDGARGNLDGATYITEYDSPADSWYYADTANDSMPHFVYMETSLQAALLMGYYAGPTLTQPGVTLSLRNLGGTATVLRQVDLRNATIEQTSRLLSTTILPGSSLQTFDYTLSVDGEPFYRGETMFGYFSDEALGNQTGLDAGRFVPTWLAGQPGVQPRVIDVAARRADPAAMACSHDRLALIDRVEVVDGGGNYGAGYLRSLRAIDDSDWFFTRHFYLDPVIPGSLGVESVIHAVQEWMLDAGFAEGMADPVFRIPQDLAFSWRYRGQFLPSDGSVELEAHIKSVRRGPHGVTVVVDGSLWKPGLRIYELVDLAVELADRKARP
ncbi:beta-ketoacyl synthase [Nocardia sp. NBC_01327]|uniref:beta-ketoacyl synthase n=1 Tax=Nocardia sp. NBC_01327 TaxID=2903593 RepID=UPI002E0FD49E|nr:beta-ketoacyl synthase [Nocardia sp. NBC_01327]